MDCLINIDVENLDDAISFYEHGIGLRLSRRLFGGAVAEMIGASCPIYLLTKKSGTSATALTPQLRDYRRHWTPVHVDLVVPDIDSAVQRAVAAGARLEDGPRLFAWGHLATISDPFGHGLCFVQWVGKGYAEVE
jgi:predicted enzyme related to lactoylglutathione lyase